MASSAASPSGAAGLLARLALLQAVLSLLVVDVLAASTSNCGCPGSPAATAAVCGTDGVTYASKCELDCAVTAVEGLSVARRGPCLRSSSKLGKVSEGAEGQSPLQGLARCTMACRNSFRQCQLECDTAACEAACVDKTLLDCNCACTAFTTDDNNNNRQQGSSTLLSPASPPFWKQLLVAASTRTISDTQAALDCYNRAMERLDACAEPCTPTRDEACAMECARPAFDTICGCERAQQGGGGDGSAASAPAAHAPSVLTAAAAGATLVLLRAPR